jgi:hypothetical protein
MIAPKPEPEPMYPNPNQNPHLLDTWVASLRTCEIAEFGLGTTEIRRETYPAGNHRATAGSGGDSLPATLPARLRLMSGLKYFITRPKGRKPDEV